MKPLAIIGIVLIVAGVIGLVYGGITYTTRQTVLQVGPLQVTAQEKKTVPVPSIVGGVLVAGGVILLIVGATARR